MDMLRSSILGKEFVNYRKTTVKDQRLRFSERVRMQGIGNIPIVLDSVDKEITEALCYRERRNRVYGKETIMHMDKRVSDVLKEARILLLQADREDIAMSKIQIGLESGVILDPTDDLGTLYKKYRNVDDKILYLLITKEMTILGYIKSIISYLFNLRS